MQTSSWKISQDQPGEVLAHSGFWPPTAPRGLRFDKAAKLITLRRFFGDPTLIEFSSLRGLRFFIGPQDSARLKLQLSILYTKNNEPRTLSLSFRVEELDKHEEALDWIFRVAQIIGWTSYLLYQKDEHGIELELRPESQDPFRDDVKAKHEVPEITEPANYSGELQPTQSLTNITKQDPLRPRFQEPAQKSQFDPIAHEAVEAWDPPKLISLYLEAGLGPIGKVLYLFVGLPLQILLWVILDFLQFTLMLVFGLIGALIVSIPLFIWNDYQELPGWLVALPSLLVGVAFVLFYMVRLWEIFWYFVRCILWCFSREVYFEREKGTFVVKRARIFWSRLQLSNISAITLVRRENPFFKTYIETDKKKSNLFKKGGSEAESAWYEVRAKVGLFGIFLWEGKEAKSPNRQECYDLAVALARVLDVPFREE